MKPIGSRLPMTSAQYIELVDYTGRQLKPGKRGVIASSEPPALRKLGIDADYWTGHVKGFRSAYQRFVGGVEAMTDKAVEPRSFRDREARTGVGAKNQPKYSGFVTTPKH